MLKSVSASSEPVQVRLSDGIALPKSKRGRKPKSGVESGESDKHIRSNRKKRGKKRVNLSQDLVPGAYNMLKEHKRGKK